MEISKDRIYKTSWSMCRYSEFRKKISADTSVVMLLHIAVLLMSKLIMHKEIVSNYSIHFVDALW